MTTRRIVYTCKKDKAVRIYCPSDEIFRVMQCGGEWADHPRGFMDRQIWLQIEGGHDADAARRFAHAVQYGGCSEAEVWSLVRDRDCMMPGNWKQDGILHEIQDAADLPPRRWFRNAWSRSPNGGPVVVNMHKARLIQLDRIKLAIERHNTKRIALGRRVPLRPEWARYGNAIRHARDEDELYRIWPKELAA